MQTQEDVRFRVLRLLQNIPEMSQRELSQVVAISVGSVHYVLAALVEKGRVKLGNFTAAQYKRRYAYLLTPSGMAEKVARARGFLRRKIDEYEALKNKTEALSQEVDGATLAATGRK